MEMTRQEEQLEFRLLQDQNVVHPNLKNLKSGELRRIRWLVVIT